MPITVIGIAPSFGRIGFVTTAVFVSRWTLHKLEFKKYMISPLLRCLTHQGFNSGKQGFCFGALEKIASHLTVL